ncbi:MAG: ParB/RepB/Spo0J family partition protein [Phycisphaerae bacterium]
MKNTITAIAIEQLEPHPDNPNKMGKSSFAKLVRNIERTGRYEPLIVRAVQGMRYQIINGHHRFEALKKLGHESCDCVVWDVDDDETDLLLATLNRLCGSDVLEKKLKLIKKMSEKHLSDILPKVLPYSKAQIKRMNLINETRLLDMRRKASDIDEIARPFIVFLSAEQMDIVNRAIDSAVLKLSESSPKFSALKKAHRNAQALACISQEYLTEKSERNQQ